MRYSIKQTQKWAIIGIIASIFLSSLVAGTVYSMSQGVPVSLNVPPASVRITGYASPGAFVTITDTNTPAATTVADSSGYFEAFISSIPSGIKNIGAAQQDINGDIGKASVSLVSVPPQQQTDVFYLLAPTFVSNKASLTQDTQVVFSGYTTPGADVKLFLDNQITYAQNTIAGADGFYSFTVTTINFFIGQHNARAEAESIYGQHNSSSTITYLVNPGPDKPAIEPPPTEPTTPSPPSQPGVSSPTKADPPIITNPLPNEIISDTPVLVSGSTNPNSQINIELNGVIVGSVFSNNLGYWEIYIQPQAGSNSVRVQVCQNNICSDFTNVLGFTFTPKKAKQCSSGIELDNYRFVINKDQTITIKASFNSGQPQPIILDWGDGKAEQFSLESNQFRGTYKHTYSAVGLYNGFITTKLVQEDCFATKYFSVVVKEPKNYSYTLFYALLIGSIIALLVSLIVRIKKQIKTN
jgi:hypothetical protein